MNLLTEIDGHKFNIGALRSRLANIISEARDSELRVVAMTADDLIAALLAERTQAKQQFSLAEEGLANYAQENERMKALLLTAHTALLAFVTTYNGRPSRFREAEAASGDVIVAAEEALDQFLYPPEPQSEPHE